MYYSSGDSYRSGESSFTYNWVVYTGLEPLNLLNSKNERNLCHMELSGNARLCDLGLLYPMTSYSNIICISPRVFDCVTGCCNGVCQCVSALSDRYLSPFQYLGLVIHIPWVTLTFAICRLFTSSKTGCWLVIVKTRNHVTNTPTHTTQPHATSQYIRHVHILVLVLLFSV